MKTFGSTASLLMTKPIFMQSACEIIEMAKAMSGIKFVKVPTQFISEPWNVNGFRG